ncbi:ATP-dependent Clp protease ATP-binding subunit [Spiroplasma endosymbiont of Aspidapion aeneum]|uniref:ATP-dependent Clp protease ATP-binding subunit n=1 Tax=Spiroplasma endosymbiont of Aspidapion aeneum TaxID=3066276 RepID=UPI00313D464F
MEFKERNPTNPKKIIEKYTKNITAEAAVGKIDPIIGRDDEIARVIRILSRRTKNNPILLGDPGVGKTAIVEGIAQRIVKGDVPSNLIGVNLLELNLADLIGGARYVGDVEERVGGLINALEKEKESVVLFIDEVHMIKGAGQGSEGATDVANLLKPALARGKLKTIGATTLKEYKKHIEKDAALARRFQQVMVTEPTIQETISILRGLKDRFETYHGVIIHDNALVSAVELSDKYISERFLPDKAIDLIDEACATVKTELTSVPTELDQINRKVMQLEIEKTALMKEEDIKSKERLADIDKELIVLKEQQNKMKFAWEKEKNNLTKISRLRETIDSLNNELDVCQAEGKFERAGEIRYSLLPALTKELQNEKGLTPSKIVSDSVTSVEIANVVEKWTGIQANGLLESDRDKLQTIENRMKKRVKGQNHAIEKVVDAIVRSRSGIRDPRRPVGSFLFLGTTGVGKTEVASALAEILFNSEKRIVRLDMSEYMDKFSSSKLIGSPSGYVGFGEGGYLTEAVRRQPYSIILFDEIEKAHPDILNLLLQILDEGRLSDAAGIAVDFKNTIIIMTSNIGASSLLETEGALVDEKSVLDELSKYVRPEFLNRIDNIIVFNSISPSVAKEIILKQLKDVEKRVESNTEFRISFSDSCIEDILKNGFDKTYGARSIRRYIESNIEKMIARAIINSEVLPNKKYVVEFVNNKYKISSSKALN